MYAAGLSKYSTMQRDYYDRPDVSTEALVGCYDYHENFPYETFLLHINGDIRKPILSSTKDKHALDIACGEGRMIRRMSKFFGAVDGVDISTKMVAAARLRCPRSRIYLTHGTNCGAALENHYDFAYCTISLQHICVHEIRTSILRDVVRVLNSDGTMTLQMLFSKHFPYVPVGQRNDKRGDQDAVVQIYANTGQHAQWMENRVDATSTNSDCDVVFGEKDIALVKSEMEKLFERCEMWFFDISIGRGGTPRILPFIHPNAHIGNNYWDYWGTHFAFIHCSGPRKDVAQTAR